MLGMDGMEGIEVDVMGQDVDMKDPDCEKSTIPFLTPVEEINEDNIATPTHLPRLLQLPVELLQLILRHMDVATFFTSLLACKHLHTAATSRRLLYYQLKRLPGLSLGLEELNDEELLRLFQRRAAENAQAVGVLANVSHYSADRGWLIAKSALSRHEQARPHSKYTTLAIPSESGTIQLYEVTKRLLRKREVLFVHHEDGNAGRVDIIKLAFAPGSKDLAVLCTQDLCPDEDSNPYRRPLMGNFARDAMTYKLVVFHRLYAKQKGHFYSSSQQETRDVVFSKAEKVVGLTLSPNGHACIVWKDEGRKKGAMVWFVHRNNELMEGTAHDPSPRLTPIIYETSSMHGLIHSAEFSQEGKSLDLFEGGYHFPSWRTGIDESDRGDPLISGVSVNGVQLPLDIELDGSTVMARRGPTFYTRHTGDARLGDGEEPLCRWTELFLAYIIEDEDCPYPHPTVFIVLHEQFRDASRCDHVNNIGPNVRFGHSKSPLALLGGYRQGSSTLGTIIAISPDGIRIAASVWNHIYIWSFNPKLLAEGDLSLYFPPQDFNSLKGYGRLRPSLLSSSAGVVHSMFWASEDVLYAVTDRGLSKFDMNAHCEAIHDEFSLTWDTWSTTALSEPAPGAGDETLPPTLSRDDDDD